MGIGVKIGVRGREQGQELQEQEPGKEKKEIYTAPEDSRKAKAATDMRQGELQKC